MRVRSFRSGGRGPVRHLAILAAAAATVLALAPAAASAASTPFGVNLVKNASFEHGLSGWETFETPVVRRYSPATGGFPSPAQSARIGGGAHFLYLGANDVTGCPDVRQSLFLKGIAGAIDSGHVKVQLRGSVATQGGASFNAHFDLYFRTANNHGVSSNGITRSVSQSNQQYVSFKITKKLVPGTRLLGLHLWADGDDPSTTGDCPAFYDKLSVVLLHA
jgi:hypothetical protein